MWQSSNLTHSASRFRYNEWAGADQRRFSKTIWKRMLMRKVLVSKHFFSSSFNSRILCLLVHLFFPECRCLWGLLGFRVVFDEKYCSSSGPGYSFQTESRSPCNSQETNQNLIQYSAWGKCLWPVIAVNWWAWWLVSEVVVPRAERDYWESLAELQSNVRRGNGKHKVKLLVLRPSGFWRFS